MTKRQQQLDKNHKTWRAKQSPARLKELNKKWKDDTKKKVIDAYGGKCYCCGETILAFLTVDHPNADGAAHRKSIGGGGYPMYLWLIRHNYPKEFRAACWNCNCGRRINGGVCPHQLSIP